jgi:hypothetical protein
VESGTGNVEILAALTEAGYRRSYEAIRLKRQALNLPSEFILKQMTRVASSGPNHRVYVADTNQDEPIEELLERAVKQSSRAVARAQSRPYALARIVTKHPVALTFVSDQHIQAGHGATDMARMYEDAELIQQTPSLYALLGGDGVDNHIKHRRALVESGSLPADEWRLYNHYLGIMGHKILGVIAGNHDHWARDFAGIDMVFELAQKQKIHYAPDEIVLMVELVDSAEADSGQRYTIKMRHKYRFNSSLNVGHTVKRMYDMAGDQFDIGCVCHNHVAHLESFDRHGLTRYAVRPGSYQIQTSFGSEQGYGLSYPTCPTAILWPNERRIVPFHDIREATEYLEVLRA